MTSLVAAQRQDASFFDSSLSASPRQKIAGRSLSVHPDRGAAALMAQRTTRSSITFKAPFRLTAFDSVLPAGTYDIDTEEEIVEGNERTVYIRVATLLYLRTHGMVQTVTIDPNELQSAHATDRAA